MVHAAIDPVLIIYLLVVFVWSMARFSKQKNRRGEGPDDEPTESTPERRPPVIGNDLRELLETLTGQKMETPAPAPVKPPPQPPEPVHRRRQLPPQHRNLKPAPAKTKPPEIMRPDAELPVAAAIAAPTARGSTNYVASQSIKMTSLRSSPMG